MFWLSGAYADVFQAPLKANMLSGLVASYSADTTIQVSSAHKPIAFATTKLSHCV